MTSILELKEIEFCYDSSIKILDKVNLKVDEGEVITILVNQVLESLRS